MDVRLLGTGDAFGSGGRFNTCFHVGAAAGAFLIDCGASSMVAIRKFGIVPNEVRTIFISHLHGDHFGGLPFFLLDARLISRRAAPLTIAGPPGIRERLAAAMENAFPGSNSAPPRFELEVQELQPGIPQNVNGVEVTPHLVKHPSGAPPLALRFRVDGRVIAYSGDTEWVDELKQAACEADLFIAEAYLWDKQVKFHLDYATLVQHLPEIRAKRVVLTHMSADMLGHAVEARCECAHDGMLIILD